MKIFLPIFIIILLGLGCILVLPEKNSVPAVNAYTNPTQSYRIIIPAGFEIDDSIPELVVIQKDSSRLRVNSGCYDFGLENLTVSTLAVQINGNPALKEDYYSGPVLKLRRYSLNHDGKCYALDLYSDSEIGWDGLENAVKTFRFVEDAETKGGFHAKPVCFVCNAVLMPALGSTARVHPPGSERDLINISCF